MPYIDRNEAGQVVGAFEVQQQEGQEFLEEGHPEVQAYRNPPTPVEQQLEQLAFAMGQLITEGQKIFSGNPLPEDTEVQIYDLEGVCLHRIRRGAIKSVRRLIEAFELPLDREDITDEHRQGVDALKAQMLALLPAGA